MKSIIAGLLVIAIGVATLIGSADEGDDLTFEARTTQQIASLEARVSFLEALITIPPEPQAEAPIDPNAATSPLNPTNELRPSTAQKYRTILRWDRPANRPHPWTQDYIVQWRRSGRAEWATVERSNRRYDIMDTPIGRSYEWRVQARDGAWTDIQTFTAARQPLPSAAPAATPIPSKTAFTFTVRALALGPDAIEVGWSNVSNACTYDIAWVVVGHRDGVTFGIEDRDAPATSVIITGYLHPSTTYRIFVRAYDCREPRRELHRAFVDVATSGS